MSLQYPATMQLLLNRRKTTQLCSVLSLRTVQLNYRQTRPLRCCVCDRINYVSVHATQLTQLLPQQYHIAQHRVTTVTSINSYSMRAGHMTKLKLTDWPLSAWTTCVCWCWVPHAPADTAYVPGWTSRCTSSAVSNGLRCCMLVYCVVWNLRQWFSSQVSSDCGEQLL